MTADLGQAQHTHWQSVYQANPHMYGGQPSEPARYAADIFVAERATRVLELGAGHGRDSLSWNGRNAHLMLGAAVMVLTQLIMVAIMTMTPIHMQHHGHDISAAGLVIAVHVAAMYLPSPFSGLLVDRFGRLTVAAASGLTLLAAGLLAALAPSHSVGLLALALALLGLGWNFGLVSGTAIITDTVPLATRAKTQGTVDVAIAVAGAGGGMASGFVVAASSYTTLAIIGGALALAIIPAVAYTARP